MSEAAAYSRLDRLLHRLALGNRAVAEMTFDIEQARVKPDAAAVAEGRHVIVAGLARAGTTVLMRRFHASGAFRSLTYRDMPFVLAPGLWGQLSGRGRSATATAGERAHGDGVMVDADSPEGLEEVFWRVFAGADYLKADRLVPHRADAELIDAYRRFVGSVLASGTAAAATTVPGAPTRYLAKNNNSILRLPALVEAFPKALVLVPWRDPLDQAHSLLAQHRRFGDPAHDHPFTRAYMGWLGHHEFGPGHRPFRVGAVTSAPSTPPDTLDYWLGLWTEVYGWLAETAPAGVRFVGYEALCEDAGVWAGLAAAAELPVDFPGAEAFERRGASGEDGGADPALVAAARAVQTRLATLSAA
ncbi:MAG: sulfotransferase [Pseudomonadota bacterium]